LYYHLVTIPKDTSKVTTYQGYEAMHFQTQCGHQILAVDQTPL
jgi:hypothetical protein